MPNDVSARRTLETAGATPVERMYFAWNDALAHDDADALLSLYAEDAVLESPLVRICWAHRAVACRDGRNCAGCSTCSPSASRRCGNTTGRAISPTASA